MDEVPTVLAFQNAMMLAVLFFDVSSGHSYPVVPILLVVILLMMTTLLAPIFLRITLGQNTRVALQQ